MFQKKIVFLLAVVSIFLLTGCASMHTRVNAESTGALKGSLAQTINHNAWDHFEETGEWYEAPELARSASLSTYNRDPENNFAVYILEKPYHDIPETMDKSQTFAFYSHDFPDSSKYVYCRIFYNGSDRDFESPTSEPGQAHDYAMLLLGEEVLWKFYKQATDSESATNLKKIIKANAEEISTSSPNPTAKQLLYEYAFDLLGNFYADVVNADEEMFYIKLLEYSTSLGEYIKNQDWTG